MTPKTKTIVGSLFCLAALIAWGQGSDRLLASIIMGSLLVVAATFPYRIHPTPKTLSRSNDLTLVVIAFSALWFYLQRQSLQTNLAIHLLASCPFFLYPKLLFGFMLAFDEQPSATNFEGVPRDGVALARRWMEREFAFSRKHLDKKRGLSFQDIYFFLAVFVAAFSLPVLHGVAFSGGAILLYCATFAWNPRHTRSASLFVAVIASVACVVGGVAGSAAIRKGQDFVEEYYSQIWNHRPDAVASANSTETAIGRRGKLDNGSKLVMRLEWPGRDAQRYLRNGIFSYTPNGSAWYASPPSKPMIDKPLFPLDGNSFVLDAGNPSDIGEPLVQAKISMTMSRERSAMALPIGSHEIFGLPLAKLDMNPMGVPTTSGSQGFARYGVTFSPSHDAQPSPGPADTDIPLILVPAIDQFLDESKSRGLGAAEAAAVISAYFKSHWTYTLNLQDNNGNARSLSRFLLRDREGHCEYFATATTLALRRLGFPARYSTGYLVSEFDERENLYWIRTRDSHAWSSVWTGRSWSLVDSTPGGPPEAPDWSTSGFDLLSRVQYMIEDFDPAALTERIDARLAILVLVFALALLAYRLRFGKSISGGDPASLESIALSREMARLGKSDPSPLEPSFDHWRRLAPLFTRHAELEELALARERALFMPMDDRAAALADCEKRARTLRRSLSLAPKTKHPGLAP